MNSIQNKLDAKARDIGRCQERERELQLAFIEGVGESPFMEYLNKVFKKKYKPPKATDGNDRTYRASTTPR